MCIRDSIYTDVVRQRHGKCFDAPVLLQFKPFVPIKELKRQEAIRADKAAKEKAEAEALGEKLKSLTVVITTKCGENGKLFGAVTNKEIAEKLEKDHGIKIDKRKIELEDNIKTLGTYTPTVKLHQSVSVKLTVKVTE